MAFDTQNSPQVRHDGSIPSALNGKRHIVGGVDFGNGGIYSPGALILDSIDSSGVTGQHALWINDTTNAIKISTDISALPTTNALYNTVSSYNPSFDGATIVSQGISLTAASASAQKISAGVLSSSNDTSGVHLDATNSKCLSINCDTGGAALTAGNIRAGVLRFLIGTAISSGADISTYGAECLLKSIVSVNVGGNQAGVLGHYESAGTLTLTGSINVVKSGVAAFLDLAANATVASSTVVSAYGVNPANFGTTMNGRSTIIHVTNPMAGTWGSFLELSTATGCTQDSAAGSGGHKYLKVYINGVLYTIDMATA